MILQSIKIKNSWKDYDKRNICDIQKYLATRKKAKLRKNAVLTRMNIRLDEMKLPYGVSKDDFERCKKIVVKLTNDNKNSVELTLKIMNTIYSTGRKFLIKTQLRNTMVLQRKGGGYGYHQFESAGK